jgi:hypothetical protein
MINISGYIWYGDVVDKLSWKHHLTTDEVEEVFQNKPRIHRIEKGRYQVKMCMMPGVGLMPADM